MSTGKKLRELINSNDILLIPGVHDGLVAKVATKVGFEALYMTGAGVSYTMLGKPDIGLTTMTEMVSRASYIYDVAQVPIIADGDTGYGNAINVIRTVKEYEKAGIACIQLEDQSLPKRCGHMQGKILVSTDEMVGKIKAACDARKDDNFMILARTDARASEGLEAALERAQAYVEAGADALFIEAPQSKEEMEKICCTFNEVPLLANMVEGGKTPIMSKDELKALGYSIIIYPGAACRVYSKAMVGLMQELKEKGSTLEYLNNMYIFGELNDILDLNDYKLLEEKYLAETTH
ncbi:MAG: isocitrate lyase/phosphoenolpyruvate mutase family protein [Clostridia bacterium]|nr:isocitrate lyase/phosphoenolpyruvate mutase family protein [Clostridia bacterium]